MESQPCQLLLVWSWEGDLPESHTHLIRRLRRLNEMMYIKHSAHSLAQNKPPNYYYYLELQKLSIYFTTLEVKVFPSEELGGWIQFLSFLCSSTSLQFFRLSWPLKPFLPPNNHLHLHSTFNFKFFHIYYLLILIVTLWSKWAGEAI